MEMITSYIQERETPTSLNSPTTTSTITSTTTSTTTTASSTVTAVAINTNNNNNGGLGFPITRSDPNSPYPTTFVTADTSSFKQVVQLLTGSSDPTTTTTSPRQPPHQPPSSATTSKHFVIPPKKQQGFKLYERRNSALKGLSFTPNHHHHQNASFSPRSNANLPEILSPSLLDFPSLTLSPVTPLVEDLFNRSSTSLDGGGSNKEEERAIAEKGFYLHPSPLSTPRDSEPQLLHLFPLSSPRVSSPSQETQRSM